MKKAQTEWRKWALVSGWSLVLMAVMAGVSLGYAYNESYQIDATVGVVAHLQDNMSLYRVLIGGLVVIAILDFIVSWGLYKYFEAVDRRLSLYGAFFRVVYTIILVWATTYLLDNLDLTGVGAGEVINSVDLFHWTWTFGLIIFGIHLFFIGLLMRKDHRIPRALYYLMMVAAVSYIVISVMKTYLPDLQELAKQMESILAAPMAIGELSLAVWLIIKGGKD
jgi:hypothetical protein